MKHIHLTPTFRGVKSIGINLLDHVVLLVVMVADVAIVPHVLAAAILRSKVPNVVANGVR